jgi:hypothetical protein
VPRTGFVEATGVLLHRAEEAAGPHERTFVAHLLEELERALIELGGALELPPLEGQDALVLERNGL